MEDSDMRQRFRSSLAALAAVLLSLVVVVVDMGRPREALAGDDTARLDPSLRRAVWNIPFYLRPTFTMGAATPIKGSAVSGTNYGTGGGFLMAAIVRDTAHSVTRTTSIAQAPYPTRLKIGLVSSSSVSGSKCSSVVVTYLDPNLLGHTETFTSVGLTAQQTTTFAVEKLQRVAATGCTNAGAAQSSNNDSTMLAIAPSTMVWVPLRIHTAAGIVSVCKMLLASLYGSTTPQRGVAEPSCAPQSQLTALVVNDRSNTVDLSSLSFGNAATAAPAWGDAVYIGVRGSTY